MDRQGKEKLVVQLREMLAQASLMVMVDYRGLTVGQMNKLRQGLRNSEGACELVVVKNTLMRRAIDDTDFVACLEFLTGPNAILLGYDDPVSPAKALVDAAKEMPALEIKGGVFSGKVIDEQQVRELAQMPSREESLAMLAGVLAAPMRNLASGLANIPRGLVNALSQLIDQKEKEAA
ncbi:MAG: 50S ribosomal protein L10 [Candidatus Lernaella stagnicola]|nr:50S ribosomal protein L10 [Candidatus Lernaella stagnicola]